jgi:hypothetical protein
MSCPTEALNVFLDALEKDRRAASDYSDDDLSDTQQAFMDMLESRHAQQGKELEEVRADIYARMNQRTTDKE